MPPLRTYLQSFTQLARYLLWLLRTSINKWLDGGKVLANPTTNQQPHGELSSGEHRAPAVPATPEARAARMNEIRGQMSAAGYTGETAQGNFHQPSDLLSWNRGGMADSGKHDMFGGDKKMQALQTEYNQLRSMQPQSGGSQK